jgi:hypothetical protein
METSFFLSFRLSQFTSGSLNGRKISNKTKPISQTNKAKSAIKKLWII